MRTHLLAAALVSLFATNPVQADFVGLYLGVDGWNMDSSGRFGTRDLEPQDFTLDKETKVSFFVALEHPIPLLPNVRIRGNNLDTSGRERITTQFEINGRQFDVNQDVDVDFNIQNTDLTLYYELFDNDVVSFDLGLTAKYLDGDITVSGDSGGATTTEKVSFSGVVPLVYGALEVGIPATGLSLFGEISALSIDNNTVKDYQAGLAYSFVESLPLDLAIRAGYRDFSLELDDLDGVTTDWSFDGPFAGLQLHF